MEQHNRHSVIECDYADSYLSENEQMLDVSVFDFSAEDCRLWRCKSATCILIFNVRTATWLIDVAVIINTGG